jgi:hypothetical protein
MKIHIGKPFTAAMLPSTIASNSHSGKGWPKELVTVSPEVLHGLAILESVTPDVSVLDDQTGVILGKPTIHGIVHQNLSFFYGFAISFESPFYDGFALAMLNSLANKQEYCASLGIHIEANEWPVQSLPPNSLLK